MMRKNGATLRSKLFGASNHEDDYSYLPTTTPSRNSNGTATQTQLLLDKAEEDVERKAGTMVKGVRVLKEIALSINGELAEQNSYFKQIEDDMGRTKGILDATLQKLKILSQKTHGMLGMFCLLIGFVIFVLFILYTWIR
ncbi:hypothetical protein FDP41_001893 [Naegleria fowleri]|uniref:t-SNARE coiled-coil homology domain-containing protein n=1 Tax=Naegleria fowleri TaxID=5763 RepID=A0A6A5BLD5_NAEFO|nr:uncharacterized protein FDP41_001893 [Naegleria fowleri]KAF0978823.1 hypothetical protein FDP41_001893 [Naegleria fowleri]CAG4715893.1 unnamed protein product [Naegleria fowleri]